MIIFPDSYRRESWDLLYSSKIKIVCWCRNYINVNQILPGYLVPWIYFLFGCYLLFFLYDNHSLLGFEQILKSPQEANQHQTFTKASHLLGFLMLLRNPKRKRPSHLPLLSRYLLHQDTQEQQSQRLHIVTEKLLQSLKSSGFKTMELVGEKKISLWIARLCSHLVIH